MTDFNQSENTWLLLNELVAARIVEFNVLLLVFPFKFKILMRSSITIINATILVATSDFKIIPVNLQTSKYRPVKLSYHWLHNA